VVTTLTDAVDQIHRFAEATSPDDPSPDAIARTPAALG